MPRLLRSAATAAAVFCLLSVSHPALSATSDYSPQEVLKTYLGFYAPGAMTHAEMKKKLKAAGCSIDLYSDNSYEVYSKTDPYVGKRGYLNGSGICSAYKVRFEFVKDEKAAHKDQFEIQDEHSSFGAQMPGFYNALTKLFGQPKDISDLPHKPSSCRKAFLFDSGKASVIFCASNSSFGGECILVSSRESFVVKTEKYLANVEADRAAAAKAEQERQARAESERLAREQRQAEEARLRKEEEARVLAAAKQYRGEFFGVVTPGETTERMLQAKLAEVGCYIADGLFLSSKDQSACFPLRDKSNIGAIIDKGVVQRLLILIAEGKSASALDRKLQSRFGLFKPVVHVRDHGFDTIEERYAPYEVVAADDGRFSVLKIHSPKLGEMTSYYHIEPFSAMKARRDARLAEEAAAREAERRALEAEKRTLDAMF